MPISIECLPTEVLQAIFANCTADDLTTISEVCHRWADAVQFLLLRGTCLTVSSIEGEDPYLMRRRPRTRMTMIGKKTLLKSDRKYTALEVAWRQGETDRHMHLLKELLDVCQERFPVQRLLLRAPPDNMLVQFFSDRRGWLGNLTVLLLEFKQLGKIQWTDLKEYEIVLPKLQSLRCIKSADDANLQGGRCEPSNVFTLNAPELCRLVVGMDKDDCMVRNYSESPFLEPDVCCLFLPSLKLKTSSKLDKVVMDGCADINQRHIDHSEWFLKNLQILEMQWCSAETAKKLWEKCSNLKELTIHTYSIMLHISPAMALSLEKLTIEGCSLILDDQTVFPKLRYLSLNMILTAHRINDMHLVAPQLTTLFALGMSSNQLIVHHKEPIRTMEVMLEEWDMRTNPAPPNVTKLILQWPYKFDSELNLVHDYLLYFPNLQRLTFHGVVVLHPVDLSELPIIPDLQFFHAELLTLRLTDFRKFAGLKSLILSQCIIHVEPNDEEVGLQGLDYCRVDGVAVDGCWRGDRFPIRVNERQPPIEVIQVTAKGRTVFSSRDDGKRNQYDCDADLPGLF